MYLISHFIFLKLCSYLLMEVILLNSCRIARIQPKYFFRLCFTAPGTIAVSVLAGDGKPPLVPDRQVLTIKIANCMVQLEVGSGKCRQDRSCKNTGNITDEGISAIRRVCR